MQVNKESFVCADGHGIISSELYLRGRGAPNEAARVWA